jgi:hypothetical protein
MLTMRGFRNKMPKGRIAFGPHPDENFFDAFIMMTLNPTTTLIVDTKFWILSCRT